MTAKPLGWFGIARLGLVQSAIGAVVMLVTSLLNRVMVVEYALPAALPAGLVAWHYGVQLSRPLWGHGSDQGKRRTPWILGGMAVLVLGALMAVDALAIISTHWLLGVVLSVLAYSMIGAGVGACGTSLLALLATQVAPERRAAAASITWIMMVMGIVITAGVASKLVDPFSIGRLALVSSGIVLVAFAITWLAVWRVERAGLSFTEPTRDTGPAPSFHDAVKDMLADPAARRFTIFVFLSMLAYSMQDMILEPFAGLMFGFTPGQSTGLSGVQHSGVLLGMVLVGVGGSAFGGGSPAAMRRWIFGGCIGSAMALLGLAYAARIGPAWPLSANIFALGFANGVFAVAAIGAMMALAGAGGPQREGIRMGIWGAAQAVAFGLGGLIGAVGVDIGRALMGPADRAFIMVFSAEAMLFLVAAALALRISTPIAARRRPAPRFEEYPA
jgi:BCD family chlorophyll transporter-like MFS transporter